MTELALFSVAKEALAEARRTDEVKDIRDQGVRMRLYGEQAKDRTIIADASEIIARAERKLGELIRSAKETGQLGIGRPAHSNLGDDADGGEENGTPPEPFTRVTLEDAGISKKLSAKSQKLAALDETAFEAAMKAARDKIISGDAVVVNPMKDVSTAGKKAARAEREQQLGAKQVALPEAKFGVIYADPEWRFDTWSEAGMDRSADNHYPTSGLQLIKDRDVGSLAADDCVLFLWATVPMLPQALEVMAAWGFAYKSNFEWRKDRVGTGYWNRNRHEHLLIGTRGKVPAPAMGEQYESSIEAPVGEHSAKPEIFYQIIEAYFPTLPKIELNARVARRGWVRWGYEAPEQNPEAKAADDATSGSATSEPLAVASGPQEAEAVSRVAGGRAPAATSEHMDATAGETAPLSRDDTDAMIRVGDAAKTPLAELVAQTGLTLNQVKDRRRVLGLSSRDRQREAVAESNRRRAVAETGEAS